MFFQLARVAALATATLAATCTFALAQTSDDAAEAVAPSILNHFNRLVTIGSTIDPLNGDQNPYGLAVSPVTAGGLKAGDLVVCNFNDALNIQGLGTTVEVLSPQPGARPRHLIGDPRLTGCAAIALGSTGALWIAALDANDNPIVSPAGALINALNAFPWQGAWGEAFSGKAGPRGSAAFYESNANDGSIVRINITSAGFTFDKIASGFSVNHGVPGSILAPSGLTYDTKRDVLYVVDGNANRVVAIRAPGTVPAGGIRVTPAGFAGPAGAAARVVYAGAPLNAPISGTLLFNGRLVVGNTGDNRLIEISPRGRIKGNVLVDRGATGAIFGVAATGTSSETTRIYFNDDNANAVMALLPRNDADLLKSR